MRPPQEIESAARARIARATSQIVNSCTMANRGNPLGAEWDVTRLQERLEKKTLMSEQDARVMTNGILAARAATTPRTKKAAPAKGKGKAKAPRSVAEAMKVSGPELVYGATIDFVGVAFLDAGRRASRAVARVAFRDGRPQGSGVMISERLFLTNNHVIGSETDAMQFVLEFDYELDEAGARRPGSSFALDPATFFITNGQDDLDFTLVAVGPRIRGDASLEEHGYCPISDSSAKHALGEWANIVQHPEGRYKEVVLRENRLVSRLSTVLHYTADTEPGSSGSPVFNNEWQMIALHHWGGPWRQTTDADGRAVPREVNEGIRTSAIVAALQQRRGLNSGQQALLDHALATGERFPGEAFSTPKPSARKKDERMSLTSVDSEGRMVWRFPIEISVRVPVLEERETEPAADSVGKGGATPSSEKVDLDPNYENRNGYKPGFISGYDVPLPRLSSAQKTNAAKNRDAGAGDDPYELKYQNFSVVMNKKRRLAFFTACNIDGTTSKNVDRKTGAVTDHVPGGESLAEGAEASERWFLDTRIDPSEMTNQDLYDSQTVPGYPDKKKRAWQNRMFQRGHLVRRADPTWGTSAKALRANADSFHFTNCTPQVGFFNMGSAPAGTANSGGGKLWRAIEDYVLENAVVEQKRVCVLTGPVFASGDPDWRTDVIAGFKVPQRFWKIVVWSGDGRLNATAMLADQSKVIDVMPEAIPGREVYVDTADVQDFVTTVKEIENITGLDFGSTVRDADLNTGGEKAGGKKMREVTEMEEIPVRAARRGAKTSTKKTTKKAGTRKKMALAR